MKINTEQVKYVADLARLELTPQEVSRMTEQLDRLLQYVEKLNHLETAGVMPTTHAMDIRNAFREDRVHDSLPQETALRNGPRTNDEAFIVPRVI